MHFMQHALELAQLAQTNDEVPVGAVVVCDNKIIGAGFNQPISKSDPSHHAEVQAIRLACKAVNNYRLPNCKIYSTLEPCIMCCGLIIHARISSVIFATHEPKTGGVISSNNLLDKYKITYDYGLLQKQSQELLINFFKEKR